MKTQILSIQEELVSSTWFNHLEVAAVNYKGIFAPTIKVRLYNNTSELNLFLQPSQESKSYPKLDLLSIVQEIPGLTHTKFNRLLFLIQNSKNIIRQPNVTLGLCLQEALDTNGSYQDQAITQA